MTLTVHPWVGQDVHVIGARGPGSVHAELPDGRTCDLPLAWTDYRPRETLSSIDGQPVRLSPDGCAALARFVAAREKDRRKVALDDRQDQKGSRRRDVIGDKARGRAATAALVGQARARRAGGRRTGKRGER